MREPSRRSRNSQITLSSIDRQVRLTYCEIRGFRGFKVDLCIQLLQVLLSPPRRHRTNSILFALGLAVFVRLALLSSTIQHQILELRTFPLPPLPLLPYRQAMPLSTFQQRRASTRQSMPPGCLPSYCAPRTETSSTRYYRGKFAQRSSLWWCGAVLMIMTH